VTTTTRNPFATNDELVAEYASSKAEERARWLRDEQERLPDRLGHANLAGDAEEEGRIHRRYNEISGKLEMAVTEAADARDALEELTGGDPEAFVRRVEAENLTIQLTSDLRRRIEREFAALREDLEDALERGTGERRYWRERVRAEEKAALNYQAYLETRQDLGLAESPGIRVVSPGL
jgi:hypothetical protein